ncbi:hypothetical protein CFC21_026251 [Triticum aestivum]|uniref:Receptor-like serine/threonine-protein kinase n=4 Tax=Triticum aestivum TaxID=4565 RepID=A0A3B6CFS0_WHEAT|nr:putative G-type lectin S-receptor-like serine/threonine-protein kinase At1g61610 isoform X2 [Triticum aestivum]KAF7012011.1 hypothetical protein CFC21_026251 [Triticum aestivum]
MQQSMSSLPAIFILLLLVCSCNSDDRLTPTKPLSPGDELISTNGIFALGFFSLQSSAANTYLGIWYHNISERTYVWVANRDNPITSSLPGKLVVTNTSDLVLSDSDGRVLWATKTTTKTNTLTTGVGAVLLDTGNFVVQSPNGTEIWQSYDQPTDAFLPGFKLWVNYKTHVAARIVAWKGPDDPSTGEFVLSGDTSTGLQILTWRGTSLYWRAGVWNGATATSLTKSFLSQMIDDGEVAYFTYNRADDSAPARSHWKLDHTGDVIFRVWVEGSSSSSWVPLFQRPGKGCLVCGACGPFGYCDVKGDDVRQCMCLDGFEPADGGGGSSKAGCVRKEALRCGGNSYFLTLPAMKLPDKFVYLRNRSFEECAAGCDRNCSCTAYAYSNASDILLASKCFHWTGDLVDMVKADYTSDHLHLRLAGNGNNFAGTNKKISGVHVVFKIVLPLIAFLLILTCICLFCICNPRGIHRNNGALQVHLRASQEVWDQSLEFPRITFEDIAAATDSFHDTNILGKGGFGKVYKGTLQDGKEVAIKRLSKGSEQGIEHFRNEAVLIAKLQHKNLVRLLGYCIHEDEKLLIYEYLPNKSLDKFLFDNARKSTLNWTRRFSIIKGVARGLLYLHQDSRMTIIHRDLKPSNILLDSEMNPKIADFGMARIFGGNEQHESTKHVVGTYGYMSPEYAMEGIFSLKSDTYSFGILLLEIVSGLKISSPHHLVMDFRNLIAYAWNLWKDGKPMDFMDATITESYSPDEVSKCIHIGLMCVQDSPNARPHMPSVVSMLDNEAMPRTMPKEPMYFAQRTVEGLEMSINGASLTTLDGR